MKNPIFVAALLIATTFSVAALPCTNILVTKKASTDGSTFITYAADSHVLYGELYFTPAKQNLPGAKMDVHEWDTGKYLGEIDDIEKTYSVVGNMNEHQVAIGETTWGGRKELWEKKHEEDVMDYGSLMYITLQRAKTAREAVETMGELLDKWGYASSGESFSVQGPKEVWIMEVIGKGEEKGAVWVARKIPDGYVSAHANQARIRQFPLNDKQNTLYAKDVISFAKKKGYYDGPDKDFSFQEAYAPADFGAIRFCEARVWAVFKRVSPKTEFPVAYVNGDPDAEPLPLWIKPDKKISVRDTMELMRDHFEGTELDLTKGVGAGPHGLPYRWRPLTWKYKGEEYFNERAISTQQTGFSFVAQSRSWLPGPIGGVLWFGVDDAYSTVYVPMYCGIKEVPKAYRVGNGDFNTFTWDAAFWMFNFVSNYAYSRYSDMIKDIQKVQRELEGSFIAMQPEVDRSAKMLYKQSPDAARNFLTRFSKKQTKRTMDKWKELGEHLIFKYLDGNVKDSNNNVTHPPYPDQWLERIVEESGDKYKMIKMPGEPEDSH